VTKARLFPATPFFLPALLLATGLPPSAAGESAEPYAVVVSRATRAAWGNVVEALCRKRAATVVDYEIHLSETRARLAALAPRFACFVARPEEADRPFVIDVHRLARTLDDDPYTDCLWGILTGYDAEAALRIAERKDPLVVRRVLAGTGVPLEIFAEGTWYSEGEKNASWVKERGGTPQKKACPDDTTRALVEELNRGCDLFQTSGHATERDWQIGYSYLNGQFRCAGGNLFGLDLQGRKHPVRSPSPKLYSALGNCLMGRIPDRDAMALAWMRTGGVCQMVGYTVSTWYGYGGWGVHDYFLTGRHTYAESFFLNHQALLWQLESRFPANAKSAIDDFGIEKDGSLLGRLARRLGVREKDALGLLWDRDTVAFYGDPAWEARLDRQGEPPFPLTLTEQDGIFTLEGTAREDGSWGRPPAALLPRRIRPGEVLEGEAVVTELFVLVPRTGPYRKGDALKVRFKAGTP
jgi:zinc protease